MNGNNQTGAGNTAVAAGMITLFALGVLVLLALGFRSVNVSAGLGK